MTETRLQQIVIDTYEKKLNQDGNVEAKHNDLDNHIFDMAKMLLTHDCEVQMALQVKTEERKQEYSHCWRIVSAVIDTVRGIVTDCKRHQNSVESDSDDIHQTMPEHVSFHRRQTRHHRKKMY